MNREAMAFGYGDDGSDETLVVPPLQIALHMFQSSYYFAQKPKVQSKREWVQMT